MHFIGMLQGSFVIILVEHIGDTLPQFIPSEKQDYNRHDTFVCFILLECQQLYVTLIIKKYKIHHELEIRMKKMHITFNCSTRGMFDVLMIIITIL